MNLRYTAAVLALFVCWIATPVLAQTTAPAPTASGPSAINVPGVGAIPSIPGIKFTADTKKNPEELLRKALDDYKAGNLKSSLNLILEAQDGIRVKHADAYAQLLPATPTGGWVVADADPDKAKVTLASQVAGGMNIVTRIFAASGHKVTITYIADSPMLGLLSPLISSFAPLVIGPNGSSETVKGNPAFYIESKPDPTHRPPTHALLVMLPDVVIGVSSETLPKEYLMQFANIVDYDQLKTVK